MQIGWIIPTQTAKTIHQLLGYTKQSFNVEWRNIEGNTLSVDGPFVSYDAASRHIWLWTNMREQNLPTHVLETDKSAAHKAR